MDSATLNTIMGVARAVIPAVITYANQKGLLTGTNIDDLFNALVVLGSAGWSIYSNTVGSPAKK